MLVTRKVCENNTPFWTPPIKTKYFDGTDSIKWTFARIHNNNNNRSLPPINDKEKNNTTFFEETESESGETEGSSEVCGEDREIDSLSREGFLLDITNQSNIGRINSEEEVELDRNAKVEQNSKIFIKDKSNNQIYLLEFKAVDVKLIPVHLKHRTFEENANDKCNQPKCSTTYDNVYNNKARRFCQLIKTYKIDSSRIEGKLSVMSFKKALFKKRPTYPPDPKPIQSISDPVSNLKESIIYLKCNSLDYKVKPGVMILRSSTTIDYVAEQEREKLLRSLKMELPADLKNKAQIVVNYKGDILKFTFGLSEINCIKMKISSSVGIMAKDEYSYVKEYSDISFRTIYIAVPKTNYEYTDPMIKQRQRNRTMKFNKVDPIWLDEQRKKRIREYNQCRKKSPYDDILELKIGSNIFYESFHCLNKLKGGAFPCLVPDNEYEKWVQSIQKRDLPPINETYEEQAESNFTNEVPDWDLVLNSK